MNKSLKATLIASLCICAALAGCSSNMHGLSNEEYRLVDKYIDADEMVEELQLSGYSEEEIEKELRAALEQINYEMEE